MIRVSLSIPGIQQMILKILEKDIFLRIFQKKIQNKYQKLQI